MPSGLGEGAIGPAQALVEQPSGAKAHADEQEGTAVPEPHPSSGPAHGGYEEKCSAATPKR